MVTKTPWSIKSFTKKGVLLKILSVSHYFTFYSYKILNYEILDTITIMKNALPGMERIA